MVNRRYLTACFVGTSILLSGCGGSEKPESVAEPSGEMDVREVFLKANRSCPIRMDAFVTLQEVNMVDVSNVEFLYEVNEKGAPAFRLIEEQKIRDGIINRVKSGSMSKVVINSDLRMRHAYFSVDGELLGEYVVDQYDLTGNPRPIASISDEEAAKDDSSDATPAMSSSAVRRQIELTNRYKEIEKAVYAFRDGMTIEQWEAENGEATEEPESGEIAVEAIALENDKENGEPGENDSDDANDNASGDGDDAMEGEEPVEVIEEEPAMPQAIKVEKKSKSNPAGIQSNPFFDN